MSATVLPLLGHFIGGEVVEGRSGQFFESINPATDEVLGRLPIGDGGDVDQAVQLAKQTYESGVWSRLSLEERCRALQRLATLLDDNLESLARLESMDTGKPISETRTGDVARAIRNFRFFAEFAQHDPYTTYVGEDGVTHTSVREPLGVVGLITPWNLPLYLETWKLAPALIMGNSVVLKPAELTPLSANALAALVHEAGVPPGVFNVVHGFGPGSAGEALVTHPDVKAISFTGETGTGSAIMGAGAPTLKKMSFELGGKGASVIFADADLDRAVSTACRAAFRNQGQICLAGSRLLVQESVAEEVEKRLLKLMGEIVVDDPMNDRTTMGSLISKDHRDKVASYVDHARSIERLKVVTGGEVPSHLKRGAFFAPTLLTEVPQSSRLIQDEIFGPVLTVQSFRTRDEALAMVNGTKYGLSCSIWTRDLDTMSYMTKFCRMGLVWGNTWFSRDLHCAFGGMKQSGVGREGGRYSLDFFSELKTISIQG